MAQGRKRIKHRTTFEERLEQEAIKSKKPLKSTARELLLRRARQAETAAHIDDCDWLRSRELQPPN